MTHALRYMPDSAPPDDIVERNRHFARKWDAAWAAAKKEYLAGDTAKAVCRRHRLALSTFRYHARIEGWRKCDAEEIAALSPSSPPCPSRGSIPPDLADGTPADDPERMDARNRSGHDKEGADWRHPSEAGAPPAPAPGSSPRATAACVSEDPKDDPDPAYAVLIGDARRHLAQAIRDGRSLDAQRWLRVMRELTPLTEEEAKDEVEEAMDAGVLIDLAAPAPFAKLSDDQILYAARALRRTIDSRQAKERARKSAEKLDSSDEKTLDSSLSSPACGGGGPRSGGGGEPHTQPLADKPPPLPDERDEINGFYRSRPYAASHPVA